MARESSHVTFVEEADEKIVTIATDRDIRPVVFVGGQVLIPGEGVASVVEEQGVRDVLGVMEKDTKTASIVLEKGKSFAMIAMEVVFKNARCVTE